MEARDFIQETIDRLLESSQEIDRIWKKFEEEYRHILEDWIIDEIKSEISHPNNLCKYKETCPTSIFFTESNI